MSEEYFILLYVEDREPIHYDGELSLIFDVAEEKFPGALVKVTRVYVNDGSSDYLGQFRIDATSLEIVGLELKEAY